MSDRSPGEDIAAGVEELVESSFPVTTGSLYSTVMRELQMRRRVYPGLVQRGRMAIEDAVKEQYMMMMLADQLQADLDRQKAREDLFLAVESEPDAETVAISFEGFRVYFSLEGATEHQTTRFRAALAVIGDLCHRLEIKPQIVGNFGSANPDDVVRVGDAANGPEVDPEDDGFSGTVSSGGD